MSYAQPFDYTEPYDNYMPTPNYYEAYGPRNTPMVPAYSPPKVDPYFPNPYGHGQVRTGAKVNQQYVVGYDPDQLDHTIFETYANQVMKGADAQISTSTKSKRARNINMLNHTFGSPRATSPYSDWSGRQDFFLTPQ